MTTLRSPTTKAEMRGAIVLALHKLGDEGPAFTTDVQFTIWNAYEGDAGWWGDGWMMESPQGKAFDRAMEALRAEGVVAHSDDGYLLVRS